MLVNKLSKDALFYCIDALLSFSINPDARELYKDQLLVLAQDVIVRATEFTDRERSWANSVVDTIKSTSQ